MTLTQFIRLFPLLEPPMTLTDESVFAFSKKNKLINPETAKNYFGTFEQDFEEDADVEYIPCFRLAISEEFHSIVYWRASALNYEYFLLNIDKKSKLIDRKLIGGLVAQDDSILRLACSIDINYIFFIAGSIADNEDKNSATDIQTYSLEVFPDGSIISS